MKKVILFLVLALGFIVSSASAQIAKTTIVPAATYYLEYTGTALDTLGTVTATTWSQEFTVNKEDGLFYNVRVKVADKTSGVAGVCTIALQEKHFDTDTYSTISTITWTGVGSTDTIAPFTQVTTKQYQRFFRILVTNTSGKSKIVYTKASFKKN